MPRKRKDPEAPKRPLSSYMYFSKARRPKLLEENPNLPFGEYSRMIADEWKNLNEEDKTPYKDQSLRDKDRYEEEMKSFKEKKKVEPVDDVTTYNAYNDIDYDDENSQFKNLTTQQNIDMYGMRRHQQLQQKQQKPPVATLQTPGSGSVQNQVQGQGHGHGYTQEAQLHHNNLPNQNALPYGYNMGGVNYIPSYGMNMGGLTGMNNLNQMQQYNMSAMGQYNTGLPGMGSMGYSNMHGLPPNMQRMSSAPGQMTVGVNGMPGISNQQQYNNMQSLQSFNNQHHPSHMYPNETATGNMLHRGNPSSGEKNSSGNAGGNFNAMNNVNRLSGMYNFHQQQQQQQQQAQNQSQQQTQQQQQQRMAVNMNMNENSGYFQGMSSSPLNLHNYQFPTSNIENQQQLLKSYGQVRAPMSMAMLPNQNPQHKNNKFASAKNNSNNLNNGLSLPEMKQHQMQMQQQHHSTTTPVNTESTTNTFDHVKQYAIPSRSFHNATEGQLQLQQNQRQSIETNDQNEKDDGDEDVGEETDSNDNSGLKGDWSAIEEKFDDENEDSNPGLEIGDDEDGELNVADIPDI